MRTFATETEFNGAIEEKLRGTVDSTAIRNALVAGISAGEQASRRDPAPADDGLNLRVSSWVLREQDIPVTELIGIVGAAATAALAPGLIAAGAVVTALSGFAALAWKAWRRGGKLSRAEIATLGFLEVQGPMSLADLKARAPAALEGLTAADVEHAVKSLQGVELRDGEMVALIRRDAAGLWRSRSL